VGVGGVQEGGNMASADLHGARREVLDWAAEEQHSTRLVFEVGAVGPDCIFVIVNGAFESFPVSREFEQRDYIGHLFLVIFFDCIGDNSLNEFELSKIGFRSSVHPEQLTKFELNRKRSICRLGGLFFTLALIFLACHCRRSCISVP
jgi:hypothetical protein